MSLAGFQEAFSRALYSAELDPELVAQIPHLEASPLTLQQFAAYRERALQGLEATLQSVYPTLVAVMGAEEFSLAARAFLFRGAPHSVDPVLIAEPFGNFLDEYVADKNLSHLPDLATLDYGCFKSRQAIEASAMNTRIFTDLSPEQLAARRIQLHPACFWMSSPYAIYDIWRFHHSAYSSKPLDINISQEVVIIRPQLSVEVHRVDMGLVKVLDALDAGETLNNALLQGSAADSEFNAVAAIQFLIKNNLIISLY
jgi:hypothetical protein